MAVTVNGASLQRARKLRGWTQRHLADFACLSVRTVERAELGGMASLDTAKRLSRALSMTLDELLSHEEEQEDMKRRELLKTLGAGGTFALLHPESVLAGLLVAGELGDYEDGIAVLQNLYYGGDPHNAARLLPHYSRHTALMEKQPGLLQPASARLAAQAQLLMCEIATDREDFGTAQQAGKNSVDYARLAGDQSLEVAAWINLANLGFHRKASSAALHAYLKAISLLDERVTPLLKGRTYAGIAEVYGMRGEKQEALRAMGLAYDTYPMNPENDPAYPYLRASRYSLYVFGDVQSRLFLGQYKEAREALEAMRGETRDIETEPITKIDYLLYRAEIEYRLCNLEEACQALIEGARLSRELGSGLYFNKLVQVGTLVAACFPHEAATRNLSEVFG